jgi:hypothetical protein
MLTLIRFLNNADDTEFIRQRLHFPTSDGRINGLLLLCTPPAHEHAGFPYSYDYIRNFGVILWCVVVRIIAVSPNSIVVIVVVKSHLRAHVERLILGLFLITIIKIIKNHTNRKAGSIRRCPARFL